MLDINNAEEVEKAEEFIMLWGAYKDKSMGEIPNNYIEWIAKNVDNDLIASYADLIRRYREHWDIVIEKEDL